jgi:DNA-binding HxlR family transcriptional regulator
MGFKYRPLIYRSVTESLLQKPRLSYSALYKEVKDKAGKNLSHRDYSKHLKMMEEDEILHKEEIATSGKILSTYYSLTKKAIATSQLKILGIDETTLKRRGLFQLIIFFEMFKKTSLITQKQLNGLLKKIGSSLSDLEAIKTSSTSFPRSTTFKPVKGIEIVRLIQTDFKMGDVSDTYYYIVIPGFTVKEFVSYMNKLRKGKEPRPFFSHIDVTDVPFVSDMSYTEEEVMDAIDSFRKQGLIKPITEILPGEMRFDIMDESLKYFLKDIWLVHDIDLRIVYERLVYNGEPTDQDRNYLISFFGKSYADQILANAYNIRKSHKIDKIGYEKEKRIAKDFIESFSNHRRSLVQDITKRYETIIKENEIARYLIEGICYSPIDMQKP